MAKDKFCPKCGEDITDSYVPPDEDVGFSGWYCDACELPVDNDK